MSLLEATEKGVARTSLATVIGSTVSLLQEAIVTCFLAKSDIGLWRLLFCFLILLRFSLILEFRPV